MNTDTQLATTSHEPSVALMLQKVIEGGITEQNVNALGKLCDLYERMEDRKAEQEYVRAFVDLQSAMPTIEPTKPVPNRDGSIRYTYAPFEEIMEKVRPLLKAHGFTVTFDSKAEDKRITAICTLMHLSGHSKKNEFSVRIGSGPPSASEAQADGAAMTYAKRQALCHALNIVVDLPDSDARATGGPISEKKAFDLHKRVKALGVNESQFLEYAKATRYEDISETMLPTLEALLDRKEAAARK